MRVASLPVAYPGDEKLRLRIAGWARFVYVKKRAQSVSEMAERMGHSQTGLNRIIGGTAAPGLDFAVKLAVFSHESLDTFAYDDPPEQFMKPGIPSLSTSLEYPARRAR
jgi:hypothetical protein